MNLLYNKHSVLLALFQSPNSKSIAEKAWVNHECLKSDIGIGTK